MPLFTIKASNKIDTSMRLEESTAKMLDRYAHFHKGPADDVVTLALEYIFQHDKDFQQYLKDNPNLEVPASVRIKKAPAPPKTPKPNANSNGNHADPAPASASTPLLASTK